ncbi:hypothetical protein K4K49_012907 [Colletotrichum sp. SAR 10_70]|nr:hypothetical protein K4K50_006846 [Colletotrichum sp. SAR 10_71]KAI8166780.1 hypothetical protein KHU50_006665 [Colletotrichum sp. SAR 10_65]KAI8187728.1 hypothetical protein K4K51_008098 [Colletotrichum sp. SAR 10_75]KAI8188049.1 hypothetical protein K4K49_012907 [Colletotrichum sp. SAR 10_70]KAI8208528.1 hypothetical protein K4K52_001247 [Colletotrichum sp. SAR 10_76]KAI8248060.1 hypothetical protein K4K53_001138 [Colletotrichum sp. SAR 10_77]KAJ4996830.1 hypothetical protein K4K48_00778
MHGQTVDFFVRGEEIRNYKARLDQQGANCPLYSHLSLGSDTDHAHRIILINANAEFDIEYAVGIFRLATLISTRRDREKQTLRVIWVSPNSVDPHLERKVHMFFPPEARELRIKTFDLPAPIPVAFVRDLTWNTYPVDNTEFLRQVAQKIAADFGPANDSTADGPRYKDTHAVFSWDGVKEPGECHPQTLVAELCKIVAPESVHLNWSIVEGIVASTETAIGRVIGTTDDPQTTDITDETRHIIINITRVREIFDTATSHTVLSRWRLTGPRLKTFAEQAFGNVRVSPENVSIHCQLSLEDIERWKLAREPFEETHQCAFLVMALSIVPTLDLDDLLEHHFLWDPILLGESVRRLKVLGFMDPGPDMSPRERELNKDLIDRAAALLPFVKFDIQTVRLLLCMGNDTPYARVHSIIDIAAISLNFFDVSQVPLLEIQGELRRKTMDTLNEDIEDEIYGECTDVSKEVVFSGSIWLSLAIYRKLRRTPELLMPGRDMLIADGNLLVSRRLYHSTIELAKHIENALHLSMPGLAHMKQSSTKLKPDDVAFLQKSMLEAWCCQMLSFTEAASQLDVLSGQSSGFKGGRTEGWFQERAGHFPFLVVGPTYRRRARKTANISSVDYILAPLVKIPRDILRSFLKDNLSYEDLESRFILHQRDLIH